MPNLPWPKDLPAEPSHVDQKVPIRTWYRSLKDGRLWCEGGDPDEVIASGGDTLEVLRYYAVTSGWQPWDPDEVRRDEVRKALSALDGSPESALGMMTGLSPGEIEDLGGLPQES